MPARAFRKPPRDPQSERIGIRRGGNAFAEDARQRNGMRPEARRVMILGIAFACAVFAAMVLPLYMFEHSLTDYTLSVFLEDVSGNLEGLVGVFAGNAAGYETRFMAVLVCATGGAALGLCGSTYQGAFNNPLAAPKTLGVMSGGALGALAYVLWLEQYTPAMQTEMGTATVTDILAWQSSLGPFEWFYLFYGRALCSIAGCFIVVAIVMAFTTFLGRGKLSNIMVIIFGQVFSVGVTAVIQFARYYFTVDGSPELALELAQIENYTMIGTYYFRDFLVVIAPIAVCIVVVLALRNRLTLLSFGDEVANTMGVNVKRTRYAMIALCTVMTGLAISFCGHVAFLGFISAHVARRIVGPDFRYLLPASVFVGGGFIVIVQWICQSGLPFTSEYAAGAVCSIVGAILFLGIALGQRGGATGGWR